MKLYKYFSPDIINKVFSIDKYATFKCNYPKDFNDPYELFLTIDYYERPEMLAYYSEVIGELPQIPTTCFSISPSIIPMWSHYAQNLQGFVIEIDEEKLALHFPKSNFGNVDYQDKPTDSVKESLYRAYGTLKGRHLYFLRQEVFGTAYFTKSKCWSYELERRMVINPEETRNSNGLMLIDIPIECISALICGPRTNAETRQLLNEAAKNINCSYFEMKIGRSSSTPFFIDSTGTSYVFVEGALSEPLKYCANCKEPLYTDAKKCSWCMIGESHKVAAAERNTFRIYDQFGLLEQYIASMENIGHSHRK